MGDLEMTSRPSITPPVEKRSSSFFGKIPSLTSPKVDAARAFYEGFLRNVHKSAEGAPFVVTGYVVVDYAPEDGTARTKTTLMPLPPLATGRASRPQKQPRRRRRRWWQSAP